MAEWDRSIAMAQRLGIEDLEKEFYQGRRIIHKDSPIDGGVYLGKHEREAIVVDSTKHPALKKLYRRAKWKARRRGRFEETRILKAVYKIVAKAMPRQGQEGVERLVEQCGVKKDKKIALDVFLKKGVGVCRHDALACAVLLELFKKDGFLQGKVSVDRNSTYLGGHVWCRYTTPSGQRHILDVAQKYIGSMEDALQKDRWAYQRPEDY